jgi:hypothetical protein
MSDSCLNSVHLEPPRRVKFRHARQALFDACGDYTIAFQRLPNGDMNLERQGSNPLASPSPSKQKTRYWLSDGNKTYPLKIGINTLGRAPDCDVIIEDGCISRRHCVILVHTGSHCEVHDVASKNGTFLNGAKLARPSPLQAGDEIQMSGRQFILVDNMSPSRPSSHTQANPQS